MTNVYLELTPQVRDDLDRALASLADKFAIPHVADLARAALPHVSEPTREAILKALEPPSGTTPKWSARYVYATDDATVAADEVPGETTLDERGGFAFESGVIRRLIRIRDGSLDLRRWLAFVPPVHAMFARSGAEKTVDRLSTANVDLDDGLLDAFASGMAVWATENDPALELSATGIP